jgi:hypothetical protein
MMVVEIYSFAFPLYGELFYPIVCPSSEKWD